MKRKATSLANIFLELAVEAQRAPRTAIRNGQKRILYLQSRSLAGWKLGLQTAERRGESGKAARHAASSVTKHALKRVGEERVREEGVISEERIISEQAPHRRKPETETGEWVATLPSSHPQKHGQGLGNELDNDG